MNLGEIKAKPVIGIDEGEKLGEVQDLLLDSAYQQVAAVVIGGGGIFSGPSKVVPYNAVRNIGPDAVMVSGRGAVQEVTHDNPLRQAHRLGDLQQEVLSEAGERIGRVQGIDFDPQSGAIVAITIGPEGNLPSAVTSPVAISLTDVVSISDKIMVIRVGAHEPSGPTEQAEAEPAAPPSSS